MYNDNFDVGSHTNVHIRKISYTSSLVVVNHSQSAEILTAAKDWAIRNKYEYLVHSYVTQANVEKYTPSCGVINLVK